MGFTKAQKAARAAGANAAVNPPFTPEQYDSARNLIGRRQYASAVAKELAAAHRMPVDRAYRLIDETREKIIKELTAEGGTDDPVTAQFLFLQAVVSNEAEPTRNRIAASQAIIKLLGLEKFLKKLDGQGVNEFLAALAAQGAARQLAAKGDGQ